MNKIVLDIVSSLDKPCYLSTTLRKGEGASKGKGGGGGGEAEVFRRKDSTLNSFIENLIHSPLLKFVML